MKKFVLLSILSLFLFSCKNKHIDTAIKAGDRILSVTSNDVEMNQAIEKAKNTFDTFEKAFTSNKYDIKTFSIKVRFPTPSGGEHIWTTNLVRRDSDFWGSIDESPRDPSITIKVGDMIKIEKENISDWVYMDGNVMIGGYTIKVARNRMPPDERKKFDSTSHVIIRN